MILQDLEKACRDIEQFDDALRKNFSLEVTLSSSSRRISSQVRSFAVKQLSEAMRTYFQKLSYARSVVSSSGYWRCSNIQIELRLVCYDDVFLCSTLMSAQLCV